MNAWWIVFMVGVGTACWIAYRIGLEQGQTDAAKEDFDRWIEEYWEGR